MGSKTNYFRHSLMAHQDNKIIKLIDEHGVKALGVYFVLLEMYGLAVSEDEERCEKQQINLRRLASNCQIRINSLQKVLTKMHDFTLISITFPTESQLVIELSIPKFFKYFGSYQKKGELKKESKESKLNKVKESKESNTDSLFVLCHLSREEEERLIKKHGVKIFNENIDEQRNYYINNPMKKPFVDFLDRALLRISKWKRTGDDEISDGEEEVVSNIIDRVKKARAKQ